MSAAGADVMSHLEEASRHISIGGNRSCRLQPEDGYLIHPLSVAAHKFWFQLCSVAFASVHQHVFLSAVDISMPFLIVDLDFCASIPGGTNPYLWLSFQCF